VIWRVALVAAAVAVFAVSAYLALAGREPEAPPLSADRQSAEALVDSIGVNVHFSYTDTAYARQAEILSRLRELGVRHIRDAMPNPVEALRVGLRSAGQQGISATLLADVAEDPSPAVADAASLMDDGIAAVEGPNELDNSGDPAWASKLRDYMPALEAAVRDRAPGVPVIGPSLKEPSSRTRIPPDLPGLFNVHPYPGGGPPEPALGEAMREARGREVVFTETGYHNALEAATDHPPVSEEAAAVYLPRLLVTAFGAGVRRTFVYELVDEKPEPGLRDKEQHFGLLRNDLSPKPAFTAIRTLIAALQASPGKGSGGRPPWDLRADGDGEIERLTLSRRDGSHVIALWRPISVWNRDARKPVEPQPLPVRLSLGRAARDVTVWRPSLAPQPVLRRERARRLSLELGGDLVLVSFR
jgi:hypothetical protein